MAASNINEQSQTSTNEAESSPLSSCQACGRPVVQNSQDNEQCFGVCEACKKFYFRNREKFTESDCSCLSTNLVNRCRFCRFKCCDALLASGLDEGSQQLPVIEKVDFAKIPCGVCGVSSTGFHFGIISCEGCKGFFRRSVNKNYKLGYKCKGLSEGGLCPMDSHCRLCRLQRCFNAGMSLKKVTAGRNSLQRRAAISAAIRGSFLNEKICRRKRAAGAKGSVLVAPKSKSCSLESSLESEQNESTIKCDLVLANTDAISSPPPSSSNVSTISRRFTKPHMLKLELAYDDHVSGRVDCYLQMSSDWYTERAVEASTRLSDIAKIQIVLDHGTTEHQFLTIRSAATNSYMKSVGDFMIALPGSNLVSLSDRIRLFAHSYFPILAAQLSLDFDVKNQLPNHLSLDRKSPAWEIGAKVVPTIHFQVENYLREGGIRFSSAIKNTREFSLFCALLFFNPDTPNLENQELVRSMRRRYELALLQHFSTGGLSERRLTEIYQLLPVFRQGTELLRRIFHELITNCPEKRMHYTPLLKQLETQIINLSLLR